MAYAVQSSFSAGELDPALHERTTLDKYQTGLRVLRNAFIGKTGRPISRLGFSFVKSTRQSNKKSILYAPPFSNYLLELTEQNLRVHTLSSEAIEDVTISNIFEADLPYVQFAPSNEFVYISCKGGKPLAKLYLGALNISDPLRDNRLQSTTEIFHVPLGPSVSSVNLGTGHDVEYKVTFVANGQESTQSLTIGTGTTKLPIAVAEKNTLTVTVTMVAPWNTIEPTEVRVYRRPKDGQAFGFIGSSSTKTGTGPYTFTFIDYGQASDYTHLPPIYDISIENPTTRPSGNRANPPPLYVRPKACCVYQQRLIMGGDEENLEAMYASRPAYHNNFLRDYPLSADSSLTFKSGTTGKAEVLRMVDNGGLLVFTTVGIYQHIGALNPANVSLEKKGNWTIEETIPPLEVPGGLLFVDKSTNTVRNLIFSNEAGGFPGEEVSIFSNHLFVNKKIVSWAFQDGDTPLVWVVMNDGSLLSLTYQREHKMQAWAHHDSDKAFFESVTVSKNLQGKSTVYFIVKRGDNRYIERVTDRFVADLKQYVGMDSAISIGGVTLKALSGGATFNIYPVTPDDWDGPLSLQCDLAAFTNTADNGAAGSIFRFFDKDGSAIDLKVTTFISFTEVIVDVVNGLEFPSEQNLNIAIYKTYNVITGLDHLDGKSVSVLADGYVIASPLNTIEQLPEIIVAGGSITLPADIRGAFIHIGLPFASDGETLDIDTVEQKPTLLESIIVNKVYAKVHKTRGLYFGPKLPDDDTVTGMEDPEVREENLEYGIIGNAPIKPYTKRMEITIENDWDSKGRVAWRSVDPLPYEILSMIPDVTVMRGNESSL